MPATGIIMRGGITMHRGLVAELYCIGEIIMCGGIIMHRGDYNV